jgi:hypothetical protein
MIAAVLLCSGSVACLWCCHAAVYDSVLARCSGAYYWCSIISEKSPLACCQVPAARTHRPGTALQLWSGDDA